MSALDDLFVFYPLHFVCGKSTENFTYWPRPFQLQPQMPSRELPPVVRLNQDWRVPLKLYMQYIQLLLSPLSGLPIGAFDTGKHNLCNECRKQLKSKAV